MLRERPIDALKKSGVIVIASIIIGTAMGTFLKAGLGADPVTLLFEGISIFFGITPGTAAIIISAFLALFTFIFYREGFYFGTVITAIVIGLVTDLMLAILNIVFPTDPGILINLTMVIVGTVLLGFGIGMYIPLNFGVAPFDGFVLTLNRWEKRSYKVAMWSAYILVVAIAIPLGALPSIGTVIALIFVGVVAEPTKKFFSERWDKILRIKEKVEIKNILENSSESDIM